MGEVKLSWIECRLTTCRECKKKCKEYYETNDRERISQNKGFKYIKV